MSDVKPRNGRYVTTPTAEGIFSGANDLIDIPAGVIETNAGSLNVSRSFARTKEITPDDIGYTPNNGSPFNNASGTTYNIENAMINRSTITHGDIEIFNGVKVVNRSAIDVIPRATKTTPGIVIIGDNLTVDANGRISAQNSYVHPSTHPGSMITEDSTHRWTTDTEKAKWNSKAEGNHTHDWGAINGKPSTFPPSSHNHNDLYYTKGEVNNTLGGYSPTYHTHNIIKDIGNATDVTMAYSKSGMGYGEFTWLAGWNGYELRAVDKSMFLSTSGGTINGALTVTGQILSNADVVAYSDARFKTNLQQISYALDKVKRISGYKYNMMGTEKQNQVGLIAQEVIKVLPEAVYEDKNGYLGIRYTNIIPLLVEAVKELSERLEAISKERL